MNAQGAPAKKRRRNGTAFYEGIVSFPPVDKVYYFSSKRSRILTSVRTF